MNKLILETRLEFQENKKSCLERKIKKQLNKNIDLEHTIQLLQSQLDQGINNLKRSNRLNFILNDRIEATMQKLEDIKEAENDALEEYDMYESKMAIF